MHDNEMVNQNDDCSPVLKREMNPADMNQNQIDGDHEGLSYEHSEA